jgi:hypothetical protein
MQRYRWSACACPPHPCWRSVDRAEYAPLARNEEYTRVLIAMLDRKREVLARLRRDGTIDDTVARPMALAAVPRCASWA